MNLPQKVAEAVKQAEFEDYFFVATKKNGNDFIFSASKGGRPDVIAICLLDFAGKGIRDKVSHLAY